MKLVKKAFLLSLSLMFAACLQAQHVCAQVDLGAVTLTAIKSMHIDTRNSVVFADVTIIMENSSPQAVRFRNYDFEVKFKNNSGKVIPFGSTRLNEAIIPGATGTGSKMTAGQLSTDMRIAVGPKEPATTARLFSLFNVIGNPDSVLHLILEGTGEVGARLPNGWASQKGITLELEFTPSIQREVLFK